MIVWIYSHNFDVEPQLHLGECHSYRLTFHIWCWLKAEVTWMQAYSAQHIVVIVILLPSEYSNSPNFYCIYGTMWIGHFSISNTCNSRPFWLDRDSLEGKRTCHASLNFLDYPVVRITEIDPKLTIMYHFENLFTRVMQISSHDHWCRIVLMEM